VRVLFVAIDRGGSSLSAVNIGKEFAQLQDAIASSSGHLQLLTPCLEPKRNRLVQAVVSEKPDIVHFGGHGEDRQLLLLDEIGMKTNFTVEDAELLFRERSVRLVVFSVCKSLAMARALTETSVVDFAIGTEKDLADTAAIDFTGQFYRALAQGDPLQQAYQAALVATPRELRRESACTPQLLARPGVTAEHFRIAGSDKPQRGSGLLTPLQVYLSRVAESHENLTSFFRGMALDEVYVDLTLKASLGQGSSMLPSTLSLKDLLHLPAQVPGMRGHWSVLGGPGSGKTMLLRQMARDLARAADPSLIPIYFALPRILHVNEPILEHIERNLLRTRPAARGLAEELDAAGCEGRLVLLMDGLDEITREDHEAVVELLRDLCAQWPKSIFVVTSRPVGGRPPQGFTNVDIRNLDAEARIALLCKWLVGPSEQVKIQAAQIISTLESDRGFWEIAGNPLYLTLIALLYQENQAPHTSRPRLYEQVFHLLLEGKHRVQPRPIPLSEKVREALRYLATALTAKGRDHAPVGELENFLYDKEAESFRERIARYPPWENSRDFLLDIASYTGIIGPYDGEEADWRFWHRTFREALAAEALYADYQNRVAQPRKLDVDVDAAEAEALAGVVSRAGALGADPSRWAEPFALLAGKMRSPDPMIKALVQINRALGLRAMASTQGLTDQTLQDVLFLTSDPRQRSQVYIRIADLIADPERCLALLDDLRRRTRNGNDLFFIDLALSAAAHRWPEADLQVMRLRARLFDHLPHPPAALFREVSTSHGVVSWWCRIPAGTCLRDGAVPGDAAEPEFLAITHPYFLTATTVTARQYAAFDPAHPLVQWEDDQAEGPDDHPVVSLTWFEAAIFCRWLSTFPEMKGARLPTETEWEFACRGAGLPHASGPEPTEQAWFRENSGLRAQPVARRAPGQLGLYDMFGNVRQWCADRFEPSGPAPLAAADLAVVSSHGDQEAFRVLRGSTFLDHIENLNARERLEGRPWLRSDLIGLRVLRPIQHECDPEGSRNIER